METIDFKKLRHRNHNKILSLSGHTTTIHLKCLATTIVSEIVYFDERGFLTNREYSILLWDKLKRFEIITDMEKL